MPQLLVSSFLGGSDRPSIQAYGFEDWVPPSLSRCILLDLSVLLVRVSGTKLWSPILAGLPPFCFAHRVYPVDMSASFDASSRRKVLQEAHELQAVLRFLLLSWVYKHLLCCFCFWKR